MYLLLAAETTTTTMPNVVGEPLESQWILLAGLGLLVAIVVGGLWLRSRAARQP